MEARDQILIERYLAGELKTEEHLELEQRKNDDPLFRQELLEYEAAKKALQINRREELKQRFATRDAILDKKKPEHMSPGNSRFRWLWLAAALTVIILIWKFLPMPGKEDMPTDAKAIDSLEVKFPPAVVVDTIIVKDTGTIQTKPGLKPQAKPDMAMNTRKGGELFAAYFDPYKDAMMDPTTRGDEEISPVQKFQKAYWDGEYQKAAESFKQLSRDQQANDNYRFSFANALLATGKTEQAIPVLESIIKNNRSKYVIESHYILALAYIKKGDAANCKIYVEKYLNAEKAKQRNEAAKFKQSLD